MEILAHPLKSVTAIHISTVYFGDNFDGRKHMDREERRITATFAREHLGVAFNMTRDGPIIVTKGGTDLAALLSLGDYKSLKESANDV